ncbi:MAG: hypothetical protein JSS66_19130 [Armatimonadetes bacterium]|nr:hypothetical protein [Armatimonadota bacterium]
MPTAMRQWETEPADEAGIHSFFDAPFTAISNNLLQSVFADPHVNPATRLLLFIARFSTGYLKAEVVLRESFILEQTGMSRSSLYKAKNELLASGQITISHTQTGNCIYRLAAKHQCLKGATTAQEKAQQRWGSPTTDVGGPRLETPMNKEIKENLDQQHPVPNAPHSNDVDSHNSSCSQRPPGTETLQTGLLARLKGLGVDEFMAHRLIKSSSPEIITRAIDHLKTATVTNPAGYLVSEVLRGGYRDKVDPHKAQREFHREVHEKRVSERLKSDQEAQNAQQQAELLLVEFAAMPPDFQVSVKRALAAQAEREGFTRLRGWGEEHPAWRGLLAEFLRTHSEVMAGAG